MYYTLKKIFAWINLIPYVMLEYLPLPGRGFRDFLTLNTNSTSKVLRCANKKVLSAGSSELEILFYLNFKCASLAFYIIFRNINITNSQVRKVPIKLN